MKIGPNTSTSPERLLTVRQLAEHWGWSIDRVYSLAKKQQIPHVRLGCHYFFKPAEVEKWLESLTVRPKAAPAPRPPVKHQAKTDREWCQELGLDESEAL